MYLNGAMETEVGSALVGKDDGDFSLCIVCSGTREACQHGEHASGCDDGSEVMCMKTLIECETIRAASRIRERWCKANRLEKKN